MTPARRPPPPGPWGVAALIVLAFVVAALACVPGLADDLLRVLLGG